MPAANWTDAELTATTNAYLQMLDLQVKGAVFSKTETRNRLLIGPLKARTAPSVEYRMRNISAVLEEMGRPWLPGYAPATNVGQSVRKRLRLIIEKIEGQQALDAELPMVFFNIGWMTEYAGNKPQDRTIGGHGHLSQNDHGYECFNFKPLGGRVYGYRPGEQKNLEIGNLGGSKNDPEVSGVLVVWIAREPLSKTTRIIGWYRDATVLRTAAGPGQLEGNNFDGVPIRYTATAREEDATLLPIENREFEVPSARTEAGGYGQSVTWYGGSPQYRQLVRNYVETVERNARKTRKAKGPPRNPDVHLRRLVERIAVDHAIAHFTSPVGGGYLVRSVELEAKGWDLEATRGDERLLIEVKGLSGPTPLCEVTPNEYGKMRSVDHRDGYVIYIVTQCLAEDPLSHVFRRNTETGEWASQDGRSLNIVERVAAVLGVAPRAPMSNFEQ